VVDISVSIEKNTMSLKGELSRHTLMQVPNNIVRTLLLQTSALVDLQQVSKVDTAGLAWLFYLLEQAQQANCQLRFANLPTKLDNLINLSGVEGFLPK
jgi:phospholipid transport system transporter-binding protein